MDLWLDLFKGLGLLVAAYLLGSLPFGFWLGQLARGKHFDIRNFGSGNIGATNCLRVLGAKGGAAVFLADTAKGFPMAYLAKQMFPGHMGEFVCVICLMMAMAGHAYSWYFKVMLKETKFSGGKSVATALGGILALNPLVAIFALAIFVITTGASGYVSVGSLAAALSTLIISIAFGLGPVVITAFAIITLFLFYTHRKNIGRLAVGTEPKWWKKSNEITVAFAMHPRDLDDFSQNRFTSIITFLRERGLIKDEQIERILKSGIIIEAGEIAGIKTNTVTIDLSLRPEDEQCLKERFSSSIKVKVILIGIMLLPSQLEKANQLHRKTFEKEYGDLLDNLLRSAAVLAKRRRATVLGLGGLLSSCSPRGGEELQRWVSENQGKYGGLSIVIDNGAAYTAASTIAALEIEADNRNLDLNSSTVAVIGARGLIGKRTVYGLCGRVGKIIAVARENIDSISELSDIAELAISSDLSILKEADVVVLATNSPGAIITLQNCNVIKEGAMVLDVAYPVDFDDKVLEARPDIKLIRCGLIRLPGEAKTMVDVHFGWVDINGNKQALFPACLAQAVMLGLTRCYSHASRSSKVTNEDVDFFHFWGPKLGFEVITSYKSEQTVYSESEG